ncbi:MAG: MMPL family transporter [Myxococcales bacterium]|nr:MMPL family transporter [Myxococcales bacterium]
MSSDRTIFERLAAFQTRYALLIAAVAVVIAAGSVPFVMRLGLNSSWEALLPSDKPSVRDLDRIRGRIGGFNTLIVAIESKSHDVDAMQRFARDLIPRLEQLPPSLARSVDYKAGVMSDFVYDHRFLYAKLSDLEEAKDALKKRLDYEKAKANPFYIDLGEGPPADPAVVIERLQKDADKARDKAASYPGGFFVHPDRDMLAIFVRSDLGGGDAEDIERLVTLIRHDVAALDPSHYGPDLTVHYAGNLVLSMEEHQAIKHELLTATVLTVVLVLLSIYVFFRNWRSLFILGGTLVVPVIATFAIAQMSVHYLTTSTAFLGSIVIGNGINPNIIWLARYFEERRHGHDPERAIERTHHAVWLATLTASLAAAIAYGSLIITDFRGFRDFGIIGGVGMVLCWFGALGLLPVVCALNERVRPLVKPGVVRGRNVYGALFSRAVFAAPKTIAVTSGVLGLAAIALIGWAVAHDPLEYNFRKLSSEREDATAAQRINHHVGDIASSASTGNGIAVVVDTDAEAEALQDELVRLRDEHDAPWGSVTSIYSLLPTHQQEKIALLGQIRSLLGEYRPYASPKVEKQIDENMPPAEITPLTKADLPEPAARPFTERDGTRGHLIMVGRKRGHSVWDGKYLVEWAQALRAVRLPDGSRPPLAGRAPVFADMISSIVTAGPRTIAVSFFATLALVLVAFRRTRERLFTMGSLLLGIAWMGGTMALAGMKLNFLNFVAFPITFGNGVDYGVNVMRRFAAEHELHRAEGGNDDAAVRAAIEETGGAVILCSLTTVIGYATLFTSANQAINSFGAAMSISEVTCLVAAVITMPAMLLITGRRHARTEPTTTEPGGAEPARDAG